LTGGPQARLRAAAFGLRHRATRDTASSARAVLAANPAVPVDLGG
jgi:hypothetical protein